LGRVKRFVNSTEVARVHFTKDVIFLPNIISRLMMTKYVRTQK